MIPVRSYEVLDFIGWLEKRRRSGEGPELNSNNVYQLASEFLLQVHEDSAATSLRIVLAWFQWYVPEFGGPQSNLTALMERFVNGDWQVRFHGPFHYPAAWRPRLHELLAAFVDYCLASDSRADFEEAGRSAFRHFVEGSVGDVSMHNGMHIYMEIAGENLLELFTEFLKGSDPGLIANYQKKYYLYPPRRKRREDVSSEQSIYSEPNIEVAAGYLVEGLSLLLRGEYFKEPLPPDPVVFKLAYLLGVTSADTAMSAEFLSWVYKHGGGLPEGLPHSLDVLPQLARDFVRERGFDDPDRIERQILEWLLGKKSDRFLGRVWQGLYGKHVDRPNPIERYLAVPFHAIFVFPHHRNFPVFFQTYHRDLQSSTRDLIDIYYAADDVEKGADGYALRQQLRSIPLAVDALPALIVWGNSLDDNCVICLKDLEDEDIFEVVTVVVREIESDHGVRALCAAATEKAEEIRMMSKLGQSFNAETINIGVVTGPDSRAEQIIGTLVQSENTQESEMGKALERLRSAVLSGGQVGVFSDTQQAELLERIVDLGDQAKLPNGQREESRIASALTRLGSTLAGVAAAATIWQACEPVLRAYFGI